MGEDHSDGTDLNRAMTFLAGTVGYAHGLLHVPNAARHIALPYRNNFRTYGNRHLFRIYSKKQWQLRPFHSAFLGPKHFNAY